jgi:hypothetical protein
MFKTDILKNHPLVPTPQVGKAGDEGEIFTTV